jgi:hypothetical protein
MNAIPTTTLIALICSLACLFLCAGLFVFSLKFRKEFSGMSTRRSTFAAFTPQPATLPFVRGTPRVYVIRNQAQGRTVRSVGYNYKDALDRMGWAEKDCIATDFGPTRKPPAMVEFQTPAADPEHLYAPSDEGGKD